ncbi:hypothetical protein J2S57_002120 [Kineosporia succinea]|uniref:Uncharacterized protein n=1 Tax=Kineosporia succinea TaxID=84632 RepID=A0ABT9P134_9ACTN|nr:hypothetical protein [Kineosporia succinea]
MRAPAGIRTSRVAVSAISRSRGLGPRPGFLRAGSPRAGISAGFCLRRALQREDEARTSVPAWASRAPAATRPRATGSPVAPVRFALAVPPRHRPTSGPPARLLATGPPARHRPACSPPARLLATGPPPRHRPASSPPVPPRHPCATPLPRHPATPPPRTSSSRHRLLSVLAPGSLPAELPSTGPWPPSSPPAAPPPAELPTAEPATRSATIPRVLHRRKKAMSPRPLRPKQPPADGLLQDQEKVRTLVRRTPVRVLQLSPAHRPARPRSFVQAKCWRINNFPRENSLGFVVGVVDSVGNSRFCRWRA